MSMSTVPTSHDPLSWVHQPPGATALDIVCLGWSAPPSAVSLWDPTHAVIAVSNPVNEDWVIPLTTIANTYDNCRITAWSLGVLSASRLLGDITHAQFLAVNGVLDPFPDCLDPQASTAMATRLSPAMLTTFQMGMCGRRAALTRWQALSNHPNLAHAQAALRWWIDLASAPIQVPADQWCTAVISGHDRIMRPQAQADQWGRNNTPIHQVPAGAHWLPEFLVSPW